MTDRLEFIITAKDDFSKTFGKLSSSLPSIKTLAIGASAGLAAIGAASVAVAGTATAVFALTKQTAETYDKIQKLSDQLGVGTAFLSKMQVASNFSGIAIETMEKSVQKLQIGLGEAYRGIGTAKDAFNALGVSIFTASGQVKTAEQIMPELASGLHNVANASERAELASKLFGQRGVEMLQMFTGGADGLKKMSDEAERFGVVVSAKAAANAALFNDAIYRNQLAITGLKNAIAEQAMPYITGLANRFAFFVADNRDKILSFGADFIKAMGWIAEKGAYAVAVLVDSWRAFKIILETDKIIVSQFAELFLQGVDLMVTKMQGFLEVINVGGVFDGAISKVQSFTQINQQAIGYLQQTADTAWNNISALANEKLAVSRVTEFADSVRATLAQIRSEGDAGEISGPSFGMNDEAVQNSLANIQTVTDAQKAAYAQLLDAHDQYYLSEEERLIQWYETQAELYTGFEEAKAVLDEVYAAKRVELAEREEIEKENIKQRMDAARLKALAEREKAANAIQQVFGIQGFNLAKAINIKETTAETYAAAIGAFRALAPIPYIGPVLGAAAFAATMALGLGQVAKIQGLSVGGAAHGGLTNVPEEQTYLLNRGERVLSPRQNKDLTEFMDDGSQAQSPRIENFIVNIEVMPNATNPSALLAMDRQTWIDIVEDKIIPAFRTIETAGF